MVVRLLMAVLTAFGVIPVRVCTCDHDHHHHHFYFFSSQLTPPSRTLTAARVNPAIETPEPDDSQHDCCDCKPRPSMPVAIPVPVQSNASDELIAIALPVSTLLTLEFFNVCDYSCYQARPPTSGLHLFLLNCAFLI
jgi:hypothetical protein